MSLEDELTPEQLLTRAEARKRLDSEVARIKAQEEAGKKLPNPSHEEKAAEFMASQNIISVGEALKPVVERLERVAKDMTAFCERIKSEVARAKLDRCEFHNCELAVDMERTFFESRQTGDLSIVYDGCAMCQEESRLSLVNENFGRMGIPNKLSDACLGSFELDTPQHEKAMKKVMDQLRVGKGFLVLRGTPGTGKTHLAVAALKYHSRGLFVTEGDMIGELRQTYTDNSSQQKLVDKYRQAELLVLDELSTDVKGADIPAFLYRVLAWRYDQDLLTIITSNESFDTILDILGTRLKDRMRISYQVATMEWESYRKRAP